MGKSKELKKVPSSQSPDANLQRIQRERWAQIVKRIRKKPTKPLEPTGNPLETKK